MANVTTPNKPSEAATSRGSLMPFGSDFPFSLGRMREEFDRILDRFASDWSGLWGGKGWRWGLDVREEENAVVVEAEAPGFEPADFDIQVTDNRLLLRAARKTEAKGKEGKPSEYREQHCYQTVTLPPGIDKDKVEATYKYGMLAITLPKTAAAKGKKVPVKGT
jgi:HSP20 family protein